MAGETALSAYKTTYPNLYLLEDNNGWVAANTPNTCEFAGDNGLVLGTGFCVFTLFQVQDKIVTTPNNDAIVGWDFMQDGTTNAKINASTGGGRLTVYNFEVKATETEQQYFETWFDTQQGTSANQAYVVLQRAATTFKQWSYNASLYKYATIAGIGYREVETAKEGKDLQTITISLLTASR